jgi:hypothetical protein
VSIGRGMHPELDLGSKSNSARLDPWATVARGVREELGIKVDGTRTRFLALGLELTRMDPDLLGFVDVAYTSDEVKGAFGAGRPKDRWETSDLEFVRFDPPSVADLLSQDRSFTPATAMNLVFALLQSFDERDVQRAFAR